MRSRRAQAGFTLIELMISMTILSMIALAIYGVVVLGARSAASGERVTEKTRRLRVATDVIVRQLHSAVPIKVDFDGDQEPYFFGEESQVEFVTAAPQRSDGTGLALVRYRLNEGTLEMAEVPLYAAVVDEKTHGFDEDADQVDVVLLYDVDSVVFSYRRDDGEGDEWSDSWDAIEEDQLPNVVRVEVTPSVVDGPRWYHEIPIFVGVFNEITGEEDFRRKGQARVAKGANTEQSPPSTLDGGDDDEPDDDED